MARIGLRAALRGRPPGPGERVVLFADTFTDHFSPEAGHAAVRVLERAGAAVELPEARLCCGLTQISTGQRERAREQLRRTVRALVGYARDGVPIVGLEPSCTAVLRTEAVELLHDDPLSADAAVVAGAVRTLAEQLSAMPGFQPPDLAGTEVVAQPHCHHASMLGWDIDRALLRDAGAELTAVGGCCGLAGNFGVEKGHHDVSVAIAEHALLPAVRAAGPGAVVLADGFSCRTQLDDLAGVRGVHLAELLDREP
jgi:Fe-S oxidoreductase